MVWLLCCPCCCCAYAACALAAVVPLVGAFAAAVPLLLLCLWWVPLLLLSGHSAPANAACAPLPPLPDTPATFHPQPLTVALSSPAPYCPPPTACLPAPLITQILVGRRAFKLQVCTWLRVYFGLRVVTTTIRGLQYRQRSLSVETLTQPRRWSGTYVAQHVRGS